MMTNEFNKPFIKSLIIVAFVTLITMVSTKYFLEIYNIPPFKQEKSPEYPSQQSQETIYSSVVE